MGAVEVTGTFADLMGIVLAVYAVKVAIAAADTPVAYLGIWIARRAGITT